MTFTLFSRNMALASGAGLAVVPLAFAATPSFAATDCGEGTEVLAGICEKAYETAGDYTFTVPSSVAKMSAVLVGGGMNGGVQDIGSGSFLAYGGGGGGVVFVDSVDVSAPLDITVGSLGVDFEIGAGDTSVGTHTAGGAGFNSGAPQGFLGYINEDAVPIVIGSGGGAGGSPTSCTGGAGVTASAIAAGSSLFPEVPGEPELGAGGGCTGINLLGTVGAGSGGEVYTDSGIPAASEGYDGAVYLRWTPGLPDTGLSMQPWLIGASVAGVLGGAILASGALRTRRQGRHSA